MEREKPWFLSSESCTPVGKTSEGRDKDRGPEEAPGQRPPGCRVRTEEGTRNCLEKEDEGLSRAGCANTGRPSSARQGAKAGEGQERSTRGQREGVQPWNGHSRVRLRQRRCAGADQASVRLRIL